MYRRLEENARTKIQAAKTAATIHVTILVEDFCSPNKG